MRLAPRARAGLEHVDQVARRVRVELVDHGAVDGEPVLRLGVGRQRPEDRARLGHLDRLEGPVDARARGEFRRACATMCMAWRKIRAAWACSAAARVDLASGLPVAEQEVEREPRGQAVFPFFRATNTSASR